MTLSGNRPTSPLRGSPSRVTAHMEKYQESCFRAIAAAAGCNVSPWAFDEGIDLHVTHRAEEHIQADKTARLDVQLKATSTPLSRGGEYATASLTRRRYNELVIENVTYPKLVVIMQLPELQERWIERFSEGLLLRHLYWVNLAGLPPTTAKTKTVRARTANRLDDVALCKIMEKIGKGVRP
ncbi:DUF4365 domain-containing protein [Nocardia sp. CA-107356]|uniref:DUF4365 domain-containing protein n=1 Tax=Nocardia sp. CA-107356 TaxID=3239972 RepID=UPI003D927525